MCEVVYPHLLEMKKRDLLTHEELENSIAACAEGYPFPTNLDKDQPIGGLAPESQADIMRSALAQSLPTEDFLKLLNEHAARTSA
jgi:ectoine hydroxylase-related dioxygenase (phytanoyl-CoA dioxygenase family)